MQASRLAQQIGAGCHTRQWAWGPSPWPLPLCFGTEALGSLSSRGALGVPFSGDKQREESVCHTSPGLTMSVDGGPQRQSWGTRREQRGPWAPGEACDVLRVQWLLLPDWSGVSQFSSVGHSPLSRGNEDERTETKTLSTELSGAKEASLKNPKPYVMRWE